MLKIAIIAALIIPTYALAAPKGQDWNDNTGIVRPEVATGGARYSDFGYWNGEIVVTTGEGKSKERHTLKGCVPAGKTYVGFKLVSSAYGYVAVEVYWK